ncbi:MAG: SPASM domain-containing protein [Pseudomonadota bacterium]
MEKLKPTIDPTGAFIDLFRCETPPPPTSVRIDLTPPDDGHGPDSHMSWDFFIRITREIRRAGVEDIVLAHLGDAFRCSWLPEAITFAKYFCRFPHVVVRTDVLTPTERQLRSAICAGLDCLVFNFNLACPQWKRETVRRLMADPDYLMRKLLAAKNARDDFFVETRQRCALYVAQLGCIESGDKLLDRAIHALAAEADHNAFEELRDVEGVVDADEHQPRGPGAGACACWTPFTEAHITADGFLAACRHDYSGRSHIADLKNVPFLEAWHDPAFQRLRRALITGQTRGTFCSRCTQAEPLSPAELAAIVDAA